MKTDYADIKNLNNSWVIVKRHNGNVFFVKRGYVGCDKNYPSTDAIYYDKADAEAELAKRNTDRKKCKYSIENASKYFVNTYGFSTWQNQVYNTAVSIKEFQDQNKKQKPLTTIQSVVKQAIEYTSRRAMDVEKSLKEVVNTKQAKLEELAREIDQEIAQRTNDLTQAQLKVSYFYTFDYSALNEYETQGDRLVKVLFSKKEAANE